MTARPRPSSSPGGDVATAYYTTDIPNIEVYIAVPMAIRVGLRLTRWAGPILATGPVQRALKARVARGAPGPNAAARAGATSQLWAEARDDAGRVARARLQTAEAYELTSWTAVELASRALRGGLPIGFQTPAGACGADFVLQFPGSAREDMPEDTPREPRIGSWRTEHLQLAARGALAGVSSSGVLFGGRLDVLLLGVGRFSALGDLRLLVDGWVMRTATLRVGANRCAAFGTLGGPFRFVPRSVFHRVAFPTRGLVLAGLLLAALGCHTGKLFTRAEVVNASRGPRSGGT